MKVKINAGAEIDFLTQKEMEDTLKGWFVEITRGVKYRQFSGQAIVDAAGNFVIGNNKATDNTGPDPGMLWAVTRLAVSGPGYDPPGDDFAVFIDDVSPVKLVRAGIINAHEWNVPGLNLNGGEHLIVTGTGTAEGLVYLSGQAVELPTQLAWQYL